MKKEEVAEEKRIESKPEVLTYLDRLKYALENGQARIQFQQQREVDVARTERYTNRYTVLNLFPEEDPVAALKREMACLDVENYIETVKDIRFPKRTEMRVFGKKYSEDDVYIKIRVELFKPSSAGTNNCIFIMSFHYAEKDFSDSAFPYARK